MVRAIILPLEQMPLTPNGKIDRKGLQEAKIVRPQAEVAPNAAPRLI